MKCPDCEHVELQTRTRLNIDMSFCPGCGGVWIRKCDLVHLGSVTGLFLKKRSPEGTAGLPPLGLKRPLWKELFEYEQVEE